MKKFVMLIAVLSVFASTACQKEDVKTSGVEGSGMHKIDLTASLTKTKTSIEADGEGGYSFTWNKDDQVRIWEMVENEEMASDIATIGAAGAVAQFSCSFPARTASEFKYLAVYPYQLDVSQTFKDYKGQDRFRIKMPEQQTMCSGSFDPLSDLLVSELVKTTTQPDKIDLKFGRIGAILQLCVKGLDKTIPVSSIKFSSDCLLSGFVEFNPETGEYSLDKFSLAERDRYDNPVSYPYVWLNASSDPDQPSPSFETDGSITFWFRSFPADIKEFTIEVTQRATPRSTPVTTFRRYNVVSRSGASPVSLKDGKMTRLTLNIGDAIPVEDIAITGKPAVAVTGNSYQLTYTLTPVNASQQVSWTSSDSNKARIDQYGLLTAYSSGQVTITCQAGSVSDSFVLDIDESIPDAVDLGLPSGTLWSSCNLGANVPSGYGLYFSWGDPVHTKNRCGRSRYTFWNYYGAYHDNYLAGLMGKYNFDGAYSADGQPDCKRFLDPADDPASSHLGDGWRSPTNTEFEELKTYCNTSRESVEGVSCIKFTSKINGNSIIIPLSGWDGGSSRKNEIARLWTCEQTPNWFEPDSNLEEFGGVITDVTQTNKKTWAGLKSNQHSTGNFWGSAFVIDPTGADINIYQKYFERYMYSYSVRPVKAASPEVTVPVRIKSVENLTSTSALVNVEFAEDEFNKPGGTTQHYYKFGWTKEGVTTLPSEMGTSVRNTSRTLSYTITGLSSGKEYVVYAHYQRVFTPTGSSSPTTEHFYSDNRVRFTAQADPSKVLLSFTTSPASLILELGTSRQLLPAPVPSTAPVTVTYQSTNPSIVTVDYNSGLVTAVGKGKAQIYCTAQGLNTVINYYCPVTVPDHLDYNDSGNAGNDINDDDIINGGNW